MKPEIKICGINTEDALMAAINNNADYAGFVFYQGSTRYVKMQNAATLSKIAKNKINRVGLFVDPNEKILEEHLNSVDLDYIQIHGQINVNLLEHYNSLFKKPIITAMSVKTKDDIKIAKSYLKHTSVILFDTKSPDLHGGTGQVFDWSLLKDYVSDRKWALAGGLNINNIKKALSILSPDIIDVSSGVEDIPGTKNPDKIKEFIEEVRKNY